MREKVRCNCVIATGEKRWEGWRGEGNEIKEEEEEEEEEEEVVVK